MNLFEIVGGVILIVIALAIIISVMLQETKGGLSSSIGGATNEGAFYDKSRTKTIDAQLSMVSKYAGIALFVVAIGVLAAKIYL